MPTTRTGYLGPDGSFSHEAARQIDRTTLQAFESFADILAAVADGDLEQGLVPLENALEGTVSAVLDGLLFDHDLFIQRELLLPIRLDLLARPGVTLDDVTTVTSYSHALGQCRRYLHERGVATVVAASTSQAAADVAHNDLPWAAVASPLAGELFGLVPLATSIEDHPGNETKFVVVARDTVAAPSGHDRTTIVCFQDADRPGSLYAILGHFAARDLNLTRLESRPTKKGLGDYCFVIEFEGHIADEVVGDCLTELQAHLARVKFLGSYPVTGVAASERRAVVSQARLDAAAWVAALRDRIV
jgi:prephenate dehydratase